MQAPLQSCEHPANAQERLFPARDYVTGDEFAIVHCRACGLALTHPAPLASEMGKYYPSVYYAGIEGRRFPAAIEIAQRSLYGRRVHRIERLLGGRKGRVLDVGCGPGFLLKQFQRRGWETQGTELSEASAAHGRQKLGLSIHIGELADAHFSADYFDAVVLWHVLEHVASPQATLAEVERILRPGGVALVGVPNFGSWEARWARDKWFHLDVPRHINHFTVPVLTWMLGSAGLKVQHQSFIAPEYDCFSFLQTVLNRTGLKHNLLYQLLRQGRAGVLRRESLFQIAATLLLAIPLGLASLPATVLAAVFRRGAAVSVYAGKPMKSSNPHSPRR